MPTTATHRRRLRRAAVLAVALLGVVALVTTVPPAAAAGEIQVAPGALHTCGLDAGGTIICWGTNDRGQTAAPTGSFVAVTSGSWHSCAILTDGTGTCWGDSTFGQTAIPSGSWTSLSAGGSHSCGVRPDGTAECWGEDGYGQASPPSGLWSSIDAGGEHSCGVRPDGSGECWGGNWNGQSDVPSGTWRSIEAGYGHSCGIHLDGTGACWGDDLFGQSNAPSGTWTSLAAGGRHSCGVHPDGTAECWGYAMDAPVPVQDYVRVDSGYDFACGTTATEQVTCWGANASGQLGWITSPAPPGGVVGTPYVATFTSNVPGATFEVASGSLPPGLTLQPDGALVGTPTVPGTYAPIQIEARSGPFPGGRRPVTITIAPAVTGSADIVGTVTDATSSTPLPSILVTVTSAASPWDVLATTTTDATGHYAVSGLLPGGYRVRFVDPSGAHPRTWWGDHTAHGDAPVVTLQDGQVATADQVVPLGSGRIAGRAVRGPQAAIGIAGVTVYVYDATSGAYVATATTGPDGYVVIGGLRPGSYFVHYTDLVDGGFPNQWYKLVPGPWGSLASPVSVTAGATAWASAWLA